jgi:signal recognition particle subunit SRP54
MFESLSAKFQGAFASLRSKGRLKSGDIDEIASEIRGALLDSDVALSVVDSFKQIYKPRQCSI